MVDRHRLRLTEVGNSCIVEVCREVCGQSEDWLPKLVEAIDGLTRPRRAPRRQRGRWVSTSAAPCGPLRPGRKKPGSFKNRWSMGGFPRSLP